MNKKEEIQILDSKTHAPAENTASFRIKQEKESPEDYLISMLSLLVYYIERDVPLYYNLTTFSA